MLTMTTSLIFLNLIILSESCWEYFGFLARDLGHSRSVSLTVCFLAFLFSSNNFYNDPLVYIICVCTLFSCTLSLGSNVPLH